MAMTYANFGSVGQAFEALETAQSIDPNFEATYFYRGQLFEKLNNPIGAEQQYRRALEANPRNEQAIAALQKLQARPRTRP